VTAEFELADLLGSVKRAVRATVAHEIRAAGLLRGERSPLPPPCDIDAEAEILSALLCGDRITHDFHPLQGEHFYSRINLEIFEALQALEHRGELPALDVVARELHDRGVRGPVREELECLRDAQPFRLLADLRRGVGRIMDRWRERQFLAVMQSIDMQIRTGQLDVDGARRRLEEFFA
jgi:replicative DNA helicase